MKGIVKYVIIVLFLSGCKSGQNTSSNTEQTSEISKLTGQVSHKYRANGCAAIVIVNLSTSTGPSILIPKDSLPKEFDVDGMEISFNYHPLKIPNPFGCREGIPVSLTNIRKK